MHRPISWAALTVPELTPPEMGSFTPETKVADYEAAIATIPPERLRGC